MTNDMKLIDVNGLPHDLTEHQVKMMITIGWLTFLAAWVMTICFYKTHPSAVDFSPKRFKEKMFIYIFGKKYNLICCLRSCLGCITCSDCRCSLNSDCNCVKTCSSCCCSSGDYCCLTCSNCFKTCSDGCCSSGNECCCSSTNQDLAYQDRSIMK